MYNLIQAYLSRLPGSLREEEVTDEDGTVKKVKRCIYTPHSLRATTATLLLDAGVDIIKHGVREFLCKFATLCLCKCPEPYSRVSACFAQQSPNHSPKCSCSLCQWT